MDIIIVMWKCVFLVIGVILIIVVLFEGIYMLVCGELFVFM